MDIINTMVWQKLEFENSNNLSWSNEFPKCRCLFVLQNHTSTTPLEDMAAVRAVNSHNQCLKVFVQRDYSEGTLVKFQTRFPTELEDRVGNRRKFVEIQSALLYGFHIYSFSMNSYWITFESEMCVCLFT